MDVSTKDNPQRGRYEVYADGELAGFAEYRLRGDRMALTHTETEPALQGRGLAAVLVRAALEAARDAGLWVLPYCSYVRTFIERHPEYLPLVPDDERAAFGL
jgi:uncharacterized protein